MYRYIEDKLLSASYSLQSNYLISGQIKNPFLRALYFTVVMLCVWGGVRVQGEGVIQKPKLISHLVPPSLLRLNWTENVVAERGSWLNSSRHANLWSLFHSRSVRRCAEVFKLCLQML